MKKIFESNKKKIVIGLLTILSYFFAPAKVVIPILEALIDETTIQKINENNQVVKNDEK